MSEPQSSPDQPPQPYEPPAIVSRQAIREPVIASNSGSCVRCVAVR